MYLPLQPRGLVAALVCVCLYACNAKSGSTATPDPTPSLPKPTTYKGKLRFTEVTKQLGLDRFPHSVTFGAESTSMGGGAACADYDGDGRLDIFLTRGNAGDDVLLRNTVGGLEDVTIQAGVSRPDRYTSGPTFADVDGDGWVDLFLGCVDGSGLVLYRNKRDGTFEDITKWSGLSTPALMTFSAAFADIDLDGDLDLFLTHWGDHPGKNRSDTPAGHLWINNGKGQFTDASAKSKITETLFNDQGEDFSFTPNFADINNDGYPDLLVASDFDESRVYLNLKNGTFRDITDAKVITDGNGMGAAVGDYDNDGDLDWFVTAISGEGDGNRFYDNDGKGVFTDTTDTARVRTGYWGWGASFADFDNDGWLDIIQVNGMGFLDPGTGQQTRPGYVEDPTRLFMNTGRKCFVETAKAVGLDEIGMGRGIVCFDFDRDGDLDLLLANSNDTPRMFRNDTPPSNYLAVHLKGKDGNTAGIGARICITINGEQQMRELRCGSNYVSHNPTEAHFGLGESTTVDEVKVRWPNGSETRLTNVRANRSLVIAQH